MVANPSEKQQVLAWYLVISVWFLRKCWRFFWADLAWCRMVSCENRYVEKIGIGVFDKLYVLSNVKHNKTQYFIVFSVSSKTLQALILLHSSRFPFDKRYLPKHKILYQGFSLDSCFGLICIITSYNVLYCIILLVPLKQYISVFNNTL